MLVMIGRQLRAAVRESDTVARVGGDEFIVALDDIGDCAAVIRVADKIMTGIAAPIDGHDRSLSVGASIGIALFPDHAQDAEPLRRAADAAMYQAKRQGKHRWQLAAERAQAAPLPTQPSVPTSGGDQAAVGKTPAAPMTGAIQPASVATVGPASSWAR